MRNELIDVVLKEGYLPTIITMEDVRSKGLNPSVYFRTIADRDEFVSRAPKSLRLRAYVCRGFYRGNEYGLIPTDEAVPAASIVVRPTKAGFIPRTSKVTGEVNETGDKRLLKFYALIEANCRVLTTFYPQFS